MASYICRSTHLYQLAHSLSWYDCAMNSLFCISYNSHRAPEVRHSANKALRCSRSHQVAMLLPRRGKAHMFAARGSK